MATSTAIFLGLSLGSHALTRGRVATPHGLKSTILVRSAAVMQHHPFTDRSAALANAAWDPYPFYEPDDDFQGSMRPGTRPENAPYEEVMSRAHEVDNKNVVEWSLDDRAPFVRDPDIKFLDWLEENGLLYHEVGDEVVTPVDTTVVLEDEFEFEDSIGSVGFEDGEAIL